MHQSHVMAADTEGEKPQYCVDGTWRKTDFLVVAAGARNQLLPGTRALGGSGRSFTWATMTAAALFAVNGGVAVSK